MSLMMNEARYNQNQMNEVINQSIEITRQFLLMKRALEAITEITKEPISNYSDVIVNECFDIASGELLKLDSIAQNGE